MLLSVLCIMLGWRLWRAGRYASTPEIRALKVLTVGALVVSAAVFVPVNASVRALLQPGVAAPIEQMLGLAGGGLRPLALDPWRGLVEWSVAVGMLSVGWGALAWVSRAHRGWALAWSLVGTGLLVMLLVVIQASIIAQAGPDASMMPLGLPTPRFGPYINPNHGGALVAALAPLAVAVSLTGTIRSQVVGGVALLILGVGVVYSGSRGAVVALSAGLCVCLLAAGSRRTRLAVLAFMGLSAAALVVLGPQAMIRVLGDLVAPEVSQMVDAGYVDLTTGRWALMQDASRLVAGVWPLGVGPGGFDDAYQIAKTSPAFNLSQHAHNEFIQVLVEHGLLVLLAWIAVAVVATKEVLSGIQRAVQRPDRRWLMAGFLGTCASICTFALIDFPLRLGSHGLLLALSAGAALGLARRKKHGRRATLLWRRALGGLCLAGVAGACVAVVGTRIVIPAYGSVGPILESGKPMQAILQRPTHRKAAQLWALELVKERRVEEAHRVLHAATDLYPTMPWLWRDRARLHQVQGDTAQAQEMWRTMLALDLPGRKDPLPYVREAVLGGDDPDLVATAMKVLPERADRRRQAARVFQNLSLKEEAEVLYKNALELEPSSVGSYATALLRWGRPAEALTVLEDGREACGTWRLRAKALLNLRRSEEALAAYQKVASACGRTDWETQAGLGSARLLTGDSKGEDLVNRLLDKRPGSHELRRVLIHHLLARARPSDAAKHIEHLVIAGAATPWEIEVLPRAQKGLPVLRQQRAD